MATRLTDEQHAEAIRQRIYDLNEAIQAATYSGILVKVSTVEQRRISGPTVTSFSAQVYKPL